MSAHWLDDIIALLKREGARHMGGNPEQGTYHETAAAVLDRIRESDVSHDEVRAHLARGADEAAPHIMTNPEPQA